MNIGLRATVKEGLSASFDGAPNQIHLLHLFTYNYRRAWPSAPDFTRTLWAFTLTATLLMALLAWASIRRHVITVVLALGLGFTAWSSTRILWRRRSTRPARDIAHLLRAVAQHAWSAHRLPDELEGKELPQQQSQPGCSSPAGRSFMTT